MGVMVMGVWDLLVPEKKYARSPYYPLLMMRIFLLWASPNKISL